MHYWVSHHGIRKKNTICGTADWVWMIETCWGFHLCSRLPWSPLVKPSMPAALCSKCQGDFLPGELTTLLPHLLSRLARTGINLSCPIIKLTLTNRDLLMTGFYSYLTCRSTTQWLWTVLTQPMIRETALGYSAEFWKEVGWNAGCRLTLFGSCGFILMRSGSSS